MEAIRQLQQRLEELCLAAQALWPRIQRHLQPILTPMDRLWSWLCQSPNVGSWSIIVVCGLVLLAQAMDYHEPYLPWYPQSGWEVPINWQQPPMSSLFYHYLTPYLKLVALLGGVIFHLALVRSSTSVRRLIIPLWIVCGFLSVWIIMADFYEQWERVRYSTIGQPFSAWAYTGKAVALVLIVLAPAISLSYYHSRQIWERHVLRRVAQPLAFCIVAIAAMVILSDLEDNLKDFRKLDLPAMQILGFYVNLLPHIFVEATTPALAFAVLFGFLGMNRHNEIITLLNCGVSLMRIARPALLFTAFVCLISMAANYHWAPASEGKREAMLLGLTKEGQGSIAQTNVFHYNAQDHRTWFIGSVPYNLREEKLRKVQVRQYDENGNLTRTISAPTVVWWPQGVWSFYRGQEIHYEDGVAVSTTSFGQTATGVQRLDTHWRETPWDIMVPTLNPDSMGVPDLAAYLETPGMLVERPVRQHFKSELWHRLSYAWQAWCLVVLAIPLVCRHSRSPALSAVGMVLCAFFVNHFFLNNISVKLAHTGYLRPLVAAFLPHVCIGLPGLIFLWVRSYGWPWHGLPIFHNPKWKSISRKLRGRTTQRWRGRIHRASWLNEGSSSLH